MNEAERFECAHACGECAEICLETIPKLYSQEARAAGSLAKLLLLTAEACRTAQTALLLDAPVHRYTCMAAAAICEHCAADSEELQQRELRDVIKACTDCAAQCRRTGAETGNSALSA